MDKSINDYLDLRRTQILLQLQSISNELITMVQLEQQLSAGSNLFDDSEDEDGITEAEIIEIMKSGKGPWNTKKLIYASRERNPNLRAITHPNLGEQIISIIQKNPIFKTVRPGYWELADEAK